MILEKQKQSNVLQDGQSQGSVKMSLDLESAQVLMQMLSKNLYSDAIGSTIRETASNALDSHRRAGVDDPIIVKLETNDHNNWEFSVEDFGIGLDDKDVENIISKYGKSTKRDSNTELGMMGLGFKAPLAYASSFTFVCRKDGMERKYLMYEGEEENTIDLLHEAPTDERNGVKVIIAVNWSDKYDFKKKIKEQLCYFESVYIDIQGEYDLNDDFVIHRGELVQYSSLCNDHNLHISLDNVYYPIDFQKLGISRIQVPLGLRFSLTDGLFPTPNRESIRYTKEAKETILKKIEEFANSCVTMYNEKLSVDQDIKAMIDYYSPYSKKSVEYISTEKHRLSINLSEINSFATIDVETPKFDRFKYLNIADIVGKKGYWFSNYREMYYVASGRVTQSKWGGALSYHDIVNTSEYKSQGVFLYEGDMKKSYKDYLRWRNNNVQYNYGQIKVIKKRNEEFLINKNGDSYTHSNGSSSESLYYILGLNKVNRKDWRKHIQEYLDFKQELLSNIECLNDEKYPPEYIQYVEDIKTQRKADAVARAKARKINAVKKAKLEGDIKVKLGKELEKWTGNNCKFVATTLNLKEINKSGKIYIYDLHDKYYNVDKIYNAKRRHRVQIMTVSQREYNYLQKVGESHNLMSYKEFMKGKTKTFKRLVTAYLINKLIDKYSNFFSQLHRVEEVNSELALTAKSLIEYRDKHHVESYSFDDKVYEAMLEVSKQYNLFDFSIYDDYMFIKNELELNPFHYAICYSYRYSDDTNETLKYIHVDLMKYHKKRVNMNHYGVQSGVILTREQFDEKVKANSDD